MIYFAIILFILSIVAGFGLAAVLGYSMHQGISTKALDRERDKQIFEAGLTISTIFVIMSSFVFAFVYLIFKLFVN